MSRETYNRLQHEAKKQMNDAIKRFAEQNPERFAELQEQAKREHDQPIVRPIKRYTLPGTRALTEEDIDRIVYDPSERHYFIQAENTWGDMHLFLENFTPGHFTNESALEVLIQKHARYSLSKILSIEPCNCPACIKRHGVAQ